MRFENGELLERLAREKKIAEEANAAKSRFLAAASHDLRQPLHALLVFSSLLVRNQSEASPLVAHIRDAAASLDKLFSGLLDISKLETGSVVPQFQAINVLAVAEELVREYSADCAAKRISIGTHGEAAWVLSDPFLLERVLRNLIDNAVKYTEQGEVTVEIEKGPSIVEIRVRDTGIGIAPAMSKQIFEEYFQLDNSSRDPSRGAGLGLAIVRRLAELLKASIDVESAVGKGSTFRLRLPKAPIFSSSSGGISAVEHELSLVDGVRVWLVEDHDLVRNATRQALEAWGCDVQTWSAPPAPGDVHAQTLRPDALVTDYRLANGRTGLDVIRQLRGHWPDLPVAVITGDPSIERKGLEDLGHVTVMQKPVLPDVLAKWLVSVRTS
jgi:CheY-like chemotaxis protein